MKTYLDVKIGDRLVMKEDGSKEAKEYRVSGVQSWMTKYCETPVVKLVMEDGTTFYGWGSQGVQCL